MPSRPLHLPLARAMQWRLPGRWLWLCPLLLVLSLSLGRFDSIGRHITPLRDIVVRGGDSQSRALAEQLLEEFRGSNLMNISLQEWKDKLETLPSIRQAHVQRKLPDALLIRLQASEPLARWHEGGFLVSRDGARYAGNVDQALPLFRGEAGQIGEMAAFYRQAQQLLPGGIAQVNLDARGSWQVFLSSGVLVHLGRQPLPQLRRYARHAAALHGRLPHLRAVDMRYTRGFAVQETPQEDQQ